MDSPFAQSLGATVADLPKPFADQLLLTTADECDVVLEGEMLRVWHRPAWIAPILWFSATMSMLFPETGAHVPVAMTIRAKMKSKRPIQIWDRTFKFRRQRRFLAELAYDEHRSEVVESFGPRHCLELAWDLRFEPPETLRITASNWRLRIGRIFFPIPTFVLGTVKAKQMVDHDVPSGIQMKLHIRHPILGKFFGYEGRFSVRRVPRP